MKNEKEYYVGLDIGTDSVGYAVTDTSEYYGIMKYKGKPMWGVSLFDEANLCAERRSFRTARRRLDRRQQRVLLVQELFAKEIAKVDIDFYKRIKESALVREDATDPYCLFNDDMFTDKEYHEKYPTIHHLILDLMTTKEKVDIRLVYIASAWLVAHRGHFLSDISEDNVSEALDFNKAYQELIYYFQNLPTENEVALPWETPELTVLSTIIKSKKTVSEKKSSLANCLLNVTKAPKGIKDPSSFPFSTEGIISLLAGGTFSLKELYGKEEYSELGSFALSSPDEKYEEILSILGDDGELLQKLKAINDWSILSDLLQEKRYISEAKVAIYEQHAMDLAFLKKFVKKYKKECYDEIFREINNQNYVSYSGNTKNANGDMSSYKTCKKDVFSAYLLSKLKDIEVDEIDKSQYQDMIVRLNKEVLSFMPKQVEGDNRVIPYQLYYAELKAILDNMSSQHAFLIEKDDEGLSIKEKLLSIMKYRIPYYVGPLNNHSQFAWIVRKGNGRIYPWNFNDMVDLDKSEQNFIDRMTNSCTYLPGETVLPKHSLIYEKFEVLNEINNITISGRKISPEEKQCLYNECFLKRKKVTIKAILSTLKTNFVYEDPNSIEISGLDETIKSSLSSHIAFHRLLNDKVLNESDVEKIIERKTYSEDKQRFTKWLQANYQFLNDEDVKYISGLSFKEFGRLSRKLLVGIEGINYKTGEHNTILNFMWQENVNLSELLLSDDKYSFKELIQENSNEYYNLHPYTLEKRLDEMYVSNSVKRPIIQTLSIMKDIVKANGKSPKKVFVEMARGTNEDLKNKRTKTRMQQIDELYQKVKNEDVKVLSEQLSQSSDNELQSESLFLYYMQLGKCMYTGEPIDISKLKDGTYNIEHIYPRSVVKDDSIINNKVLVLSKVNGEKDKSYPIDKKIRDKMLDTWKYYCDKGLISQEKYKRLTRSTPFSDDEKWGFINRQLVETRQSTKVITQLLKEKYPNTDIVYVRAGLVSEFRDNYEMLKSRLVNDLHHAKDAYLNIVCGNVYHEKYTKKWFLENKDSNDYTINSKGLFSQIIKNSTSTIWAGSSSISAIKKNMTSNLIHQTQYSYCKHGGFFDQNPKPAYSDSLIPRKVSLPSNKYGGYQKTTASFFVLVEYCIGTNKDVMIMPVELLYSRDFLNNDDFREEYTQRTINSITGIIPDRISLPMGNRVLKINTVFEVDGYRVCLSSKDSGGKRVGLKPIVPLVITKNWEDYIKKLEVFYEKTKKYDKYIYSEEYDKVSTESNIELYKLLMEKLGKKPFILRPENPYEKIKDSFDKFKPLSIKEQTIILINIVSSFGRSANKDSFTGFGGNCRLNSKLSNWKKYKEVFIVDASPSGIWERKSENLLSYL